MERKLYSDDSRGLTYHIGTDRGNIGYIGYNDADNTDTDQIEVRGMNSAYMLCKNDRERR